jgi:hypothetical protein
MYAYELLPKLTYLTLTVNEGAEHWEERIEFIGTIADWNNATQMEQELCSI